MYNNYIISPFRGIYKKNLIDGCVFCKIAVNEKNVAIKEVWRNNKWMVLLNIFPYVVGHLQLVPIQHYIYYQDIIKNNLCEEKDLLIEKCMNTLSKVYSPDGFNVGINLGKAAGGSVDHLHIHIVPRYFNREVSGFMETCAGTKIISEDINITLNKIKEAWI